MNCACHNEPAYWQKDDRWKTGGWWECAAKRRKRERDRYARDPVMRLTKVMKQNRRDRLATIKRRREALRGEISPEGRH